MKFRPVRELFEEAMEECCIVGNFVDLRKKVLPNVLVRAEYQCFDSRPGWNANSVLLIVRTPNGEEIPGGYLDVMPVFLDLPADQTAS